MFAKYLSADSCFVKTNTINCDDNDDATYFLILGRLLLLALREVSKYGVISGLYFLVFGMNTEIYGLNIRIQSEHRKIRTRNNSVFGHFSRSVGSSGNEIWSTKAIHLRSSSVFLCRLMFWFAKKLKINLRIAPTNTIFWKYRDHAQILIVFKRRCNCLILCEIIFQLEILRD